MSRRPEASVTVQRLPHLHPEAVRIEVACLLSTTGVTQLPEGGGPVLPVRPLITTAVFEHEVRCGGCDTEAALLVGSLEVREATDRAWCELIEAAGRRYAAGRRN